MTDKVLYETIGAVAYITLNRPEVKNAIDLEVHQRLREIWLGFRDNSELRVAILTGKGDAFCAGADLRTHVSLSGRTSARASGVINCRMDSPAELRAACIVYTSR
jgi:enoyl-CoA hydratase/carnithine racemase